MYIQSLLYGKDRGGSRKALRAASMTWGGGWVLRAPSETGNAKTRKRLGDRSRGAPPLPP